MATSKGSKPGVKAMESVTSKVKGKTSPNGKPGEGAMKSQVNPVRPGKGGANPANVGGTDFKQKRDAVRGKKKAFAS